MTDFRCGYISFLGRPNVGKSTLMNALIEAKVSITSRKPQTTRHRILGVITEPEAQYIFLDTPGLQKKHQAPLNRVLNRTALNALQDADVVLLVLEAGRITREDQQLIEQLPQNKPVILVLNKMDRYRLTGDSDAKLAQQIQEKVMPLYPFAAVVPVCATQAYQLSELKHEVRRLLPQQEEIFAADDMTDCSERFLAAEFIREQLFRFSGDEIPYTSTVLIEQYQQDEKLIKIDATILVERESHKAILIGEGGQHLKKIATQARLSIEKQVGSKVYLQIWVKVKSGWADDEKSVHAYGY